PSLPAIPRPPWTPPRISTASRFKSPRCARIAAVAIRPTASEPPDRLSRATIEGRPSQRRAALRFWWTGALQHVERYWIEPEQGADAAQARDRGGAARGDRRRGILGHHPAGDGLRGRAPAGFTPSRQRPDHVSHPPVAGRAPGP